MPISSKVQQHSSKPELYPSLNVGVELTHQHVARPIDLRQHLSAQDKPAPIDMHTFKLCDVPFEKLTHLYNLIERNLLDATVASRREISYTRLLIREYSK